MYSFSDLMTFGLFIVALLTLIVAIIALIRK